MKFLKYMTSLTLVIFSSLSIAGNKVVVIPLAVDAPPPMIVPTSPVTKVNPESSDYILTTDTVIDKTTKLEWARVVNASILSWEDAWSYCANLSLSRFADWRLPTVSELLSIVAYGRSNPAINQIAFPDMPFTPFFWSASTSAGDVEVAWSVFFETGGTVDRNKRNRYYVRCVR